MKLSSSQYSKALWEISQNYAQSPTHDMRRICEQFLKYIRKHGDKKKIPAILKQFQGLEDASRQQKRVYITTAFTIEETEMRALEQEAKRVFECGAVATVNHVNDDCIGGYILETDTEILDKSIRTQLQQLGTILKS